MLRVLLRPVFMPDGRWFTVDGVSVLLACSSLEHGRKILSDWTLQDKLLLAYCQSSGAMPDMSDCSDMSINRLIVQSKLNSLVY